MKLLQTSLYFVVFYLTLYPVAPSVLAQSHPTKRTWQISQQFKPPIDNQPNPATIGAGTRFKPPIDDDPNPPTVGAATRGPSCLKKQVMTPLLPANQSGLTLNKHPTFFWHIPPAPVKNAEFLIITDGEEKVIYKTTLTLPDQPGIVSFTLPKTITGLEANKTYRWYVTLICDPEDSSNNPYVEGLVKRIPAKLALSESLAKDNLLEMATIYAQEGIWYEALASLVKLRCNQPNDSIVKLHWRQLLDSVGLNDIVSEPLVDFCKIKN
ncbi:DUF928 domain-containing protein [Anabaena sphaerica FACHB-251]|uniref:DUF928 domain-containing protein n=1 Tax=Anabaena sphaerica FACHB-251 TaxID=2692883 RepID=A0A926WHL1_9NOST|nr:DUF928 domain-containing protein [Anabaena sphaerica]MBD2294706.1 DUF928 domain-containing protein [Anabaena sphaerica FACHB-251]